MATAPHAFTLVQAATSLARATPYMWRVRVWPAAGCASAWSAPGKFVTSMGTAGGNGFLNTTAPIWPAAPARYAFLRRVVQLDTTPARKGIIHATAFVAAAQDGGKEKLLGAYRLHVNGRPAAIGPGRGEVNYAMKNHTLYDSLDPTAAAQAAAEASAAARGLLTLALQCYHHDATGQVKCALASGA